MSEKPKSWVYFIQSENKDIKIGYAGNPRSRLADMQTAHGRPLTLLGAVPGDMTMEKGLHKRFAHLRMMGEWFRPDPELLFFIEGICYGQTPPDENAPRRTITRDEAETIAAYIKLGALVESAEELAYLLDGRDRLDADELFVLADVNTKLYTILVSNPAVVDIFGRKRGETAQAALDRLSTAHKHAEAESRLVADEIMGAMPWLDTDSADQEWGPLGESPPLDDQEVN